MCGCEQDEHMLSLMPCLVQSWRIWSLRFGSSSFGARLECLFAGTTLFVCCRTTSEIDSLARVFIADKLEAANQRILWQRALSVTRYLQVCRFPHTTERPCRLSVQIDAGSWAENRHRPLLQARSAKHNSQIILSRAWLAYILAT